MFIRKIKKKSGTYLAKVESYRENGKIKQRVIEYLGKEVNSKPVRRVSTLDLGITSVKESLDVNVIHHLAKQLHLVELDNPYWLTLVYSHLLENRSISKVSKWVTNTEIPEILGIKEISSLKLYDSLNSLGDLDFTLIEQKIYEELSKLESNKKAAIIDITDTYLEGKNIFAKRKKGKDGKVKKLIQIGLAVTQEWGFPIMHKTYEGNLVDHYIFKDLAVELKEKGIKAMVMDRGMLTPANLKLLLNLKFKTIAGLGKTPSLIKNFLAKIKRDDIYQLKNRVELNETSVYIKSFDYQKGKLITCYNPKMEYVKREQAYQRGEESKNEIYYGFNLIYHNTCLSDKEVVKKYYQKDVVERAFKQLKGVINLRPIRVRTKEHIRSHVKICYMAYALLSLMGYKLRKIMSPLEALENLKYGYKVNIKDKKNKHEWQLSVPLKPKQKKILEACGCSV